MEAPTIESLQESGEARITLKNCLNLPRNSQELTSSIRVRLGGGKLTRRIESNCQGKLQYDLKK